MTDWWRTPEFKAEVERNRALLAAAEERLQVPQGCRLEVWNAGERWTLQGGGGEVVWFEEPSQADIDRSAPLLIDPARNATGGPYFKPD